MDRAFRDVVRRSMSLAQTRANTSTKPFSASEIRKTFLDYFCKDHNHFFIRSSPVFSLKDPTLAFTNAGMNQFKDVFLGLVEPVSSRVANSQKCIRIRGLHDDLDVVGQDGSHHTFFEMLGNWSFGDYFKEEACRLSWNLLTQVYNIPPERLYVTYFGGDAALGLNPDVEVQEIWRQIGVKESHILPFGVKDNFWSGSTTGPCGPCSEIHYDHIPGRTDVGKLVNSSDEVTELWNLVFTQFDRKESGKLSNLKKQFVDTGMGLERLVAVLQGKTSNYDTDLFLPLFEVIRQHTGHSGYTGMYDGNEMDSNYRMLADHSRMITVAFSDGMIPNHQPKVRGILRKTLSIVQKVFRAKPDLLKELSNNVAEILSDAYPEIGQNLSKIHYIIDKEADFMKVNNENILIKWQIMKKSYPTLNHFNILECPQVLTGLEYFIKNVLDQGKKMLSGKDVFTLYETYGVPAHVTKEVASKLGLGFDMASYLEYQNSLKTTLREHQHKEYLKKRDETSYLDILRKLEDMKEIQPTFDYFKHDYRVDGEGKYVFPKQETTIEAILRGYKLVDEVSANDIKEDEEVGLILDRTQMFSTEGGQASDCGVLEIEKEIIFEIKNVMKIKNFVIHFGVFKKFPSDSKVSIKSIGVLHLDEKKRLEIMRNHTALHLVNAFFREILDLTGEKVSEVRPEKLYLKFMIYNKKLHLMHDVQKLEKFIKEFIVHGVSVKRKILNHPQFQALDDVVFVPGETILTREIPVIEINSGFKLSREFCTGTHLLNTSDMEDFIVTKFVLGSFRTPIIEAVTGREKCAEIRKSDAEMQRKYSLIMNEISNENQKLNPSKFSDVNNKVNQFLAEISESEETSHLARTEIISQMKEVKKLLNFRLIVRNFLKHEILKACEKTTKGFVVWCLDCPWEFSPTDLEAAAKNFNDTPILMLFKHEGSVTIQCVVPENCVSENFNAKTWLQDSALCLGGLAQCAKNQNPKFVFYLKERKYEKIQLDHIMKTAVNFAEKNFRS